GRRERGLHGTGPPLLPWHRPPDGYDVGPRGHGDVGVPARRIADHTRSGVAGRSSSVTPRGRRASTTAFITAAGAAMAPDSAAPLAPNGLIGDGVTVRSTSNPGRSGGPGTR